MGLLDVLEVALVHFDLARSREVVFRHRTGLFFLQNQVTGALVLLRGGFVFNLSSLADACLADRIASFKVHGLGLANDSSWDSWQSVWVAVSTVRVLAPGALTDVVGIPLTSFVCLGKLCIIDVFNLLHRLVLVFPA